MTENTTILQTLGIDITRYEALLREYKTSYSEVYPGQMNRPKGMVYFDNMFTDLDGLRVKELVDHKARGGKVVGTFCLFIPEEIIHAGGGIAIKLDAGTQFPISEAETILPSDLCPMIKSSLGFKLGKISPFFELADFVIGGTTCDGKKKAWEVYNDFIPTYVMELPQKKTQIDRELWLKEVYNLKEKMELESGMKITQESLIRSIEIFNRKRQSLVRLHKIRSNNSFTISGSDVNLIYQISGFDDPERFTEKVNVLCDELETRAINSETVAPLDSFRIMVTGCPMALPNWKIHHLIETNDAVVVCEDTCTGARYLVDPFIYTDESLSMLKLITSITDRYMNIPCPCFTPGYCAVIQMTEMIEDCHPDGVIYYVLQFCHGFNIEYYKMEKQVKKLGVPVLKIQSDYTEEDTGQLRTRIEAFLERLTLRR